MNIYANLVKISVNPLIFEESLLATHGDAVKRFNLLILASYVRSVWQKDDVLRKRFSSTEAVLAEMRTIRCIEHTGKMKVITPFVGSQVA